MGTPNATLTTQEPTVDMDGEPEPTGDRRLAEIDTILAALTRRDRSSAEEAATTLNAQGTFMTDFMSVCQTEVRPAMTAVLERLRSDGGDGQIEEHPGGEARFSTPRLTLWMSLQGPIEGAPRPDRHPYLQFDAEVIDREVKVTEGDMWRGGGGGHSGPVGAWRLPEITQDRVVQELLTVMRRAASLTVGERSPTAAADATTSGAQEITERTP